MPESQNPPSDPAPTEPADPQPTPSETDGPPATPEEPPEPVLLPPIITEVFPDPAAPQTDNADEFVELMNPNSQELVITGYSLRTGATTQHTVALPALTIAPGAYIAIKSADTTLSLPNTGTAVQLLDAQGVVRSESPDYQTAVSGAGWMRDAAGGWRWTTTPTPAAANSATSLPGTNDDPETPDPAEEIPPQPEDDMPPANDEPGTSHIYLPLVITELLPDPEAPQEDATDEFIELFNPNSQPVEVAGYQLQSGSNYRYRYSLPSIVLPAGGYIAITSEESGLSLSNGGSGVRLLDPNQAVVDEVVNYGKAQEGQSWAKNSSGAWQWSTTPTPGAPNTVTAVVKATTASATKKTASTKKAAAAPKVASASKTKAAAVETADQPFAEPAAPPPNYWLLAGVGSAAAGYGVYEYRQGIMNGVRRAWQLVRGKSP